jgi:hypothetical protein
MPERRLRSSTAEAIARSAVHIRALQSAARSAAATTRKFGHRSFDPETSKLPCARPGVIHKNVDQTVSAPVTILCSGRGRDCRRARGRGGAYSGRVRLRDDPVDRAAALGAGVVRTDLARSGGLDREAELLSDGAADSASKARAPVRSGSWRSTASAVYPSATVAGSSSAALCSTALVTSATSPKRAAISGA